MQDQATWFHAAWEYGQPSSWVCAALAMCGTTNGWPLMRAPRHVLLWWLAPTPGPLHPHTHTCTLTKPTPYSHAQPPTHLPPVPLPVQVRRCPAARRTGRRSLQSTAPPPSSAWLTPT